MSQQYILLCGAGAALGSLAAIMACAKTERRPVLAPVSASSHWLHGGDAIRHGDPDLSHTGLGAATNIAAGCMWGGLLGAHLQGTDPAPRDIIKDGIVMGAIAGVLDYGLLPRRLSPGWELALSDRSVVLSMAAMAGGAILGGLTARAFDASARRS